ncbi:ribonuclease H1 [Condylostylus longicornis]|uniref:ribonuclease H1 n=1 Tax=Condylostylus longicornis TaxID=2530218 RepID=UPI00244DFAB5|nr:ribonuclease H1 [Condylostylus longicornis]
MLKYFLKMPYYAVARGRVVGIFPEWHMCDSAVKAFKGAKFKKFHSKNDAIAFLKQHNVNYESNNDSDPSCSSEEESKPKEFWPDDVECDDEQNDLLLTASAEVEGLPSTSSPLKRKHDSNENSSSGKSKLLKHKSQVWEPIGLKKFGNMQFPIDSEGFVICYTDGSCEGNGQNIAAAGFGVYFSENHPLNTAKPVSGRPTNNVGEIQASIYAVKLALDLGIEKLCISTDSQFLINSITQWVKGWKKNGWRKKDGTMVKNSEDFKELNALLEKNKIEIKWNYVKGHEGIIGNEKADKLARQGAQMYRDKKVISK